jgi:hypothetical protein
MKKGIFMLAAVSMIAFTACKNDTTKGDAAEKVKEENVEKAEQRDAAAEEFAVMTFEKTSHDFGTIDEGEVVKHTFSFTNTGDVPLVITNAKGSCGCTVPQWPRESIAPGESGEIMVQFNSRGRKNNQNKSVTITANTETGTERLTIHANITPAETTAQTQAGA